MIAIVASRHDGEARALADAWNARLLDASDLCRRGWSFDVAAPAAGTCVVAGEVVPVTALAGVLTRRPAVLAAELDALARDDREYAASEIHAFLGAWLAALPCPVINRPTPRNLAGPAWTAVHWQAAAARAGLAWDAEARGEPRDVFACGARAIGARDDDEAAAVLRLAAAAGAHLVQIRFVDRVACGASAMPPLVDRTVRAAVLADLGGRP